MHTCNTAPWDKYRCMSAGTAAAVVQKRGGVSENSGVTVGTENGGGFKTHCRHGAQLHTGWKKVCPLSVRKKA